MNTIEHFTIGDSIYPCILLCEVIRLLPNRDEEFWVINGGYKGVLQADGTVLFPFNTHRFRMTWRGEIPWSHMGSSDDALTWVENALKKTAAETSRTYITIEKA